LIKRAQIAQTTKQVGRCVQVASPRAKGGCSYSPRPRRATSISGAVRARARCRPRRLPSGVRRRRSEGKCGPARSRRCSHDRSRNN
jgi:hypothetical protein